MEFGLQDNELVELNFDLEINKIFFLWKLIENKILKANNKWLTFMFLF